MYKVLEEEKEPILLHYIIYLLNSQGSEILAMQPAISLTCIILSRLLKDTYAWA